MPAEEHAHDLPATTFSEVSRLYLSEPGPCRLGTHAFATTPARSTRHAFVNVFHQCIAQGRSARLFEHFVQYPAYVALPDALQYFQDGAKVYLL